MRYLKSFFISPAEKISSSSIVHDRKIGTNIDRIAQPNIDSTYS
ncbi:hypothetical protein [Chamaesiphon sp. OTE_75_metabat_556]|nr:hypothetical protein [Chamaesiphon sp. OTE_75_metabat_556]